ncbi:glycosyltransferase family 4 protein [Arsenicicoccus piscis]|uniref:Glycosyl transferase family 1 domain-containing protein n=1 Tax=Arsenicicoccus piscis TaxID=673954 RepID=A0ABQ6HRT7_9MICO|nr:glycosyltransferase family 4 protein [Arsenicicoccus piscis]MCH8629156.1 glycosyltransferase family 4 protein [Arsenicicoccus piscis]GMA20280.1 hypothetical protein GCM10025862_23010 [Arsenicicoccus piscis]
MTSPALAPSDVDGTAPSGPLRVAYLVSQYPKLSHTFIEREVHALRERGVEVDTFTISTCPESELRSAAMRADAATTTPIKDAPRAEILAAHRALAAREPRAYAKVLAQALRSGELTARSRLWQGFYFAEAVVLHHYMEQRGLRHVHVHFANVSADVARLTVALGRLLDGPDAGWAWSMTMHGPTEFERVEKVDLAAKVRSADGISAISDFCRSQLMRLVDPVEWPKMSIVHMTVDTDRFVPPADQRAGRDGEPLRVLYVGRLVPEKGGPVLLDAVRELQARGVAVDVRFIGAGELAATLTHQIEADQLASSVTLLGPVGQDDILDWYHWADVFVLPSFQEGLPVVLMEALATELPVVTTRIAGVAELVEDGAMGHVVNAGRADLLADALVDLAQDPDRRRAMGAAGRRAVEAGFTPGLEAAAMETFLREVQERAAR